MPDATYYLPPVGGAGGHVPRAGPAKVSRMLGVWGISSPNIR